MQGCRFSRRNQGEQKKPPAKAGGLRIEEGCP